MNQGIGFRRNWRSNRGTFLVVTLVIAFTLIASSQSGLLAPLEDLLATPLNAITGIFTRLALSITGSTADIAEVQTLQQRNADLETALAQFQGELVELREIASDYQRLADLLNYTTRTQGQEFVPADVISFDSSSGLRSVVLNRGTRDGIAIGMPVVTGQGLVGRIVQVSSNAARVMLVTDPSSAVSARLQTTRSEGSVQGDLSGNLVMRMIPLEDNVQEGDLVITSGLGGNFPPDIVIGQVTSVRRELFQEAQVRSLINFDTLEIVLIVTNFQPIDLSVFDDDTAN